jgi:hypothetical protein
MTISFSGKGNNLRRTLVRLSWVSPVGASLPALASRMIDKQKAVFSMASFVGGRR